MLGTLEQQLGSVQAKLAGLDDLRADWNAQVDANKGGRWRSNWMVFAAVAVAFFAAGFVTAGAL